MICSVLRVVRQKEFDLDYLYPGFEFIDFLVREESPMWNADATIFRRLGCYIWDLERLSALELLNQRQWERPLPSDIVLTKHNLWFTWESIHSKEELEEKENERINQFPEASRGFGSTKKETYWWACPSRPT